MRAILATGIPDMNDYIRQNFTFVEVVGEGETKEECVDILDELNEKKTPADLIVVKSTLPGNPEELTEFVSCLHGAFYGLKIMALLPGPDKLLLRLLDDLGVYYLYGEFTSFLLQEAFQCIAENRLFNQASYEENQPYESDAEEETTITENEEPEITETVREYAESESNKVIEDQPLPEYKPLEFEINHGNKLVVVYSPSHSGSTVFASNLALLAAEQAIGVGLLDLNIKKPDISTHYNINHHNNFDSILTLIAGENLNPATLLSSMREFNGVNVLLGTKQPFTCHVEEDTLVRTLLSTCKETYPLTIIDVAGSLDNWGTLASLEMADKVIVVLEQHVACLRFFNTIKTDVFSSYNITDDKVDIILNRYRAKAALSAGEVEATLNCKLACTLKETDEVYTSISLGQPLALKTETRGGRDFIRILQDYGESLFYGSGMPEKPKKNLSLMQRFFGKTASF